MLRPRDTRIQPARRNGFTRTDLLAATGSAVVLFAVGSTVLARNGGANDSHYKLMELGQAHACYAGDWNDRQWTALPYDVGQYGGNCSTYLSQSGACPPQQLLGFDSNGAMWAYYLGSSGACAAPGYPGNCGNWTAYRPIEFESGWGAAFIPNTIGFRQYLSQRFYSNEWYAEDDPAYAWASTQFDLPREFSFDGTNYEDSSYCLSPAAMFHPGVFRRPSQGGFRNPSQFADSYRAPSVSQCKYPDLKTRMCERGWYRNAPAAGLAFTAGLDAAPVTLFFDGSVATVSMREAHAQDRIAVASSGFVEGLWSRDTPFDKAGWRLGVQESVDGTYNGFHILTTDGILGRDLLIREKGGF